MEVKRGCLVIAVHGEFGRPRPVVVVQADEFNQTTTLLVCPITSNVTENLAIRPTVEPKPENGLRIRSQIMADKMLALPRDHIRQQIGIMGSETMSELDTALLLVLGLAR
jgi:mRNA interferase MazF